MNLKNWQSTLKNNNRCIATIGRDISSAFTQCGIVVFNCGFYAAAELLALAEDAD